MDEETQKILSSAPEKEDPSASPLAYTNFARKESITRSGGRIYGNWGPSFAHACHIFNSSFINEGSLIDMREVGTCANSGKIVVMANHY